MLKAKPWNGRDLKGTWHATLKIDGVRALWNGKAWMSRADKPLYNIPTFPAMPHDCEVYLGNFRDTIRAVRTPSPKEAGCGLKKCRCASEMLSIREWLSCPRWVEATPTITRDHLYSLDPLDDRLCVTWRRSGGHLIDPRAGFIEELMAEANERGYEGLVLRQGDKWVKVKPEETHDVLVTGAIEGDGKHKGRLGALLTAKGDVGTGFSDEERENLWSWFLCNGQDGSCQVDDCECPHGVASLIGQTIEVSCMQFTPDGKFRHPRFVRLRPDKIAEE